MTPKETKKGKKKNSKKENTNSTVEAVESDQDKI
jgi:hypothetical protein